ncbi:hypothetical protein [Nitrosopumilus piranensis]|uniref:Uncharacterized protein n=1 Tax=Nitrosopumilus piranensis TaxID=1582439 RepID=A0A0C5BX05_9ARCH|nr:hypothetical protein [Nitrosopumilus piranensis]AJM91480.1 hypothetical protein NPIRD3C_0262 [Nitrosopumilus piranensis]
MSIQERDSWARDWRFGVAMFLLVIGICFLTIGMFVMYINEEKIDYNSLATEPENKQISELKFSLEEQKLRSDGFGYIAIGIATILGSSPFFERVSSLKKQNDENRAIIFPILTKSHEYLDDMIKGYLECVEMIESQTEIKKMVEKVHVLLKIRTSGFLEYSDRTEKDIFFLQIKNPDLYQEILGIIQTNRLLLNHKQFDDVQYSFEREWLDLWIQNVGRLIPELRSVNQKIVSLEN